MDLVDGNKKTIKNIPRVGIQHNGTNLGPEPSWLSLKLKTIKEEKEDSPRSVFQSKTIKVEKDDSSRSVFNLCEGTNPEINHEKLDEDLLPNLLTPNYGRDLVDGNKTTIKYLPGVGIQHNGTNAGPEPTWLSLKLKTIKEEKEDSPRSVFNLFKGTNPEMNHEKQDKDFLGETYQNVMCSTFSTKCEENVGDLKEIPVDTKCCLKTQKATLNDAKLYKCNFCQEYFTDRSKLSKHMSIHTNEKPFKCEVCHKSFTQRGSLTTHLRKHKNEKPFECNICYKCFAVKSRLTIHMRIHTNEKPFKCEVCHKSFTQSGSLTTHMRIHKNEKPFINKCFTEKSTHTKHMLIHTNKKPFECDVCHKCFNRRESVTKHMRIHTNEKPFKCKVCHKSFTQKDSVRRHKRTHMN